VRTADGIGEAKPMFSETFFVKSGSFAASPATQAGLEPLSLSSIGFSLAASGLKQKPEQREINTAKQPPSTPAVKSNSLQTLHDHLRLSILEEIGESRVELSEFSVTKPSREIELETALWDEPFFWK
jgi:hypothetical protein